MPTRGRAGGRGGRRDFPRTARINEVMREVIAEQLEVIGDENLEMVTITGIDIDPDLSRAVVWFSALTGDVGVEGAVVALARHRAKLQAAVGRQVRMKRTPLLQFKPDPAITQGIRIEEVLRTMPRSERELDEDGYPVDPDRVAGVDGYAHADADADADADAG